MDQIRKIVRQCVDILSKHCQNRHPLLRTRICLNAGLARHANLLKFWVQTAIACNKVHNALCRSIVAGEEYRFWRSCERAFQALGKISEQFDGGAAKPIKTLIVIPDHREWRTRSRRQKSGRARETRGRKSCPCPDPPQ